MKAKEAEALRREAAAVKVQAAQRRRMCAARVRRLLRERDARRIEDAKTWVETWSEDANKWFYFNMYTQECLWEPPRTGYLKFDGESHVLETGQVVDSTGAAKLSKLEAEEEQARLAREAQARKLRTRPMCVELPSKFATKWDVVWDDPFSDEGWATTHTNGKRRAHPFCRIHEDGSVSPRAVGPDGEDCGEYEPGCGGKATEQAKLMLVSSPKLTAAEAYESGDGYGAGQQGVDGYGAEAAVEWTEYADEEGNPYWYNNYTGESTYDQPPELAGGEYGAGGYGAEGEADQYGAQAAEEWSEHADEEGNPYWYNNFTGESTYERPVGAGSEWSEHYDDEGNSYWYNSVTGESTYEQPWGGGEDWSAIQDENGDTYWYNAITGESSWEDPSVYQENSLSQPSMPSVAPQVGAEMFLGGGGELVDNLNDEEE